MKKVYKRIVRTNGFPIVTVFAIAFIMALPVVTGEPSNNNPRHQDANWDEGNIDYNMTYLTNRNTTARIESPNIFEFEGNGTVVMWWTVWTEGEENATQQHVVMKIINGDIVRKKITNLSEHASLKATNNPAPEKIDEITEKDTLFPIQGDEIIEELKELREKLQELYSHLSS